jgi:hypothetical protein
MTTFTVAIHTGEGGPEARSTADLDDALDWFTNAVTAVMDSDDATTFATLAADGVICGAIREGGLGGDGERLAPLRAVA